MIRCGVNHEPSPNDNNKTLSIPRLMPHSLVSVVCRSTPGGILTHSLCVDKKIVIIEDRYNSNNRGLYNSNNRGCV